jgi:hypothetical protein
VAFLCPLTIIASWSGTETGGKNYLQLNVDGKHPQHPVVEDQAEIGAGGTIIGLGNKVQLPGSHVFGKATVSITPHSYQFSSASTHRLSPFTSNMGLLGHLLRLNS